MSLINDLTQNKATGRYTWEKIGAGFSWLIVFVYVGLGFTGQILNVVYPERDIDLWGPEFVFASSIVGAVGSRIVSRYRTRDYMQQFPRQYQHYEQKYSRRRGYDDPEDPNLQNEPEDMD